MVNFYIIKKIIKYKFKVKTKYTDKHSQIYFY